MRGSDMDKRSYWAWGLALGATCVLTALSLRIHGLPETALYLAIALLLLVPVYAIRRFVRASGSLSLWRGLFILFGASCLTFILWLSFTVLWRFSLVTTLLAYSIGVSIGGYLGDKLGKRRGYMPFVE
jgi:hypothetical protein